MIGSTISHYRVLDDLGRGGMGVVYRALDTRLGREVALKFLPDEVASDGPELARFRREARAASALTHPNICAVYDVGEHEGRHFIVMELVRGVSLAEMVKSGPLPMEDVRRIGIQLAGALEAAHEHGVVHRDVKPRNVIVNERGDAKLLDFGLAKMAARTETGDTAVTLEAELTEVQRIMGTPSFMSPEQVLGRPLDGRSDLFSLGAVLYVMATGRRPFDGDSVPAVMAAVLHHAPPPATTLNPAAPEGLAKVIDRCLAKAPEARYRDARELRESLELLAPTMSASAGTSGEGALRRRWLLAGAASAGAAALVVGAFFVSRLSETRAGSARASPVIAVLPFSNQTGNAANEYLGQALSAGLLNELVEIRALNLVSPGMLGSDRGSAMRRALDLGAQVLVEGDVREATAEELRLVARVTDARSGIVLWSRAFEGGVEEILHLEGRVARGLAAFLSIPLSRRERSRLGRGSTASLEAMRAYAEGMLQLEGPGLEHAVEAFESAIRLDDEFALGHAALAQALWMGSERSGDAALLRDAVAAAERAAALDPELPQARLALALVRSGGAGSAGEVDDVASILATHPRPSAAHRELGIFYERVGRLEEAERSLREATVLDSDDWFSWSSLGVFLFRHRDLAAAKTAFERAAELAPAGVDGPRVNLAVLAIQASRFDEAIDLLEALPRGSANGLTASSLGTAYFFSDRPDKWQQAEKHYQEAVARDPQRSEYRGNLADLYAAVGRLDEARAAYRDAMVRAREESAARPGDANARLLVALYAAKAEECAQGLALADGLRTTLAPSSQTLHQLALTYSLCRDRDRALETLGAAIELGFPPAFAAQEEEFRWLAGDPQFTRLIGAAASRAPRS